MYFIIVDETCSCRLLIMLVDGLSCKVLGDSSFSEFCSDATTGNILDTIILIMKKIKMKKQTNKQKTAGGRPETHTYANR